MLIPIVNIEEVASWKWMLLDDVKKDIKERPNSYTAWFKIIFDKFYKYLSI